ncbi:YbaB/EbfC family nucleoid-associated protein [Glycomyces sp. YM15]|uniref:YbaB/EbfC family nucleoid-associated protein n=1 Tax=Glycomyces sp. YM15 TaxID=2800446 RepID=UPI001963B369|nr:YbaB/EbfC family nucleoid-associated protein [Glycomyces sp. YM15]
MPQEDMSARIAEAQRLAVEAEAEVVSETGAVRVVAGPGGRVKELDLRMSAFEISGVELGEIIAETVRAAGSKLEADLTASINDVLGGMFDGAGTEGERA